MASEVKEFVEEVFRGSLNVSSMCLRTCQVRTYFCQNKQVTEHVVAIDLLHFCPQCSFFYDIGPPCDNLRRNLAHVILNGLHNVEKRLSNKLNTSSDSYRKSPSVGKMYFAVLYS